MRLATQKISSRIRFPRTRSGVLLAGLAVLAAPFGAQAVSLPGIPESGDPTFENKVNVTVSKVNTGFKLTATLAARSGADITFTEAGTTYNVSESGDSFVLTANFDKYGTLLSTSNVEIKGQLPGYPGTESSPLYKANLDDWNIGFSGGQFAVGFTTTNPTGWARQFQCDPNCTDESVYLTNFSNVQGYWNLSGNDNDNYNYWKKSKNGTLLTATAYAITTVPLPAAGWLLGSALFGFFGAGRRKRPAALLAA